MQHSLKDSSSWGRIQCLGAERHGREGTIMRDIQLGGIGEVLGAPPRFPFDQNEGSFRDIKIRK